MFNTVLYRMKKKKKEEIQNTVTLRYKSILVTDRFQIPIDFLLFRVASLSLDSYSIFHLIRLLVKYYIHKERMRRKKNRITDREKSRQNRRKKSRRNEDSATYDFKKKNLFQHKFNGIKAKSVYGMWKKFTWRIGDIIKEIRETKKKREGKKIDSHI